ncbi:hypothetical protein [Pseudomonas sp. CFBP 8772]|uniref:hypothetical protein n=1 Tax=Pseudomonas sp. CFBP 8772 TaxID=2775284 RepID=UPI0017807313|nr:hypothetical protein [Pseudomonas sp. CFBP 8772]MBD8599177.1 hypothetical protein [Pseudomonas sp. CFBP 8772]
MKSKSTVKKAQKAEVIKNFCIVGNCAGRTAWFAELLHSKATPLGQLTDVTSDFEHLQDFGANAHGSDAKTDLELIFKRNNATFEAWYWQPKMIEEVVKSWEDLGKHTQFVLVYTSPVETLNAVTSGSGQLIVDVEGTLKKWRQDTEQLMLLSQRIPDRCLIVSADTPQAIRAGLENLKNKLKLVFEHSVPSENPVSNEVSNKFESYIANESRIAQLHSQLYQSVLLNTSPLGLDMVGVGHNDRAAKSVDDEGCPSKGSYGDDYSGIGDELLDLQEENRELTQKLHMIQEELEQKLVSNKEYLSLIIAQRLALEKVYSAFPDYWNVEAISTSILKESEPNSVVEIRLTNAEVNYKIVEGITIRVSLNPDMPSISVKPTTLDWLSCMKNSATEWLTIEPRQGALYQGPNAVISRLGPTDWSALLELLKKLKSYVNSGANKHQFPTKLSQIRKALSALYETLNAWPMVPRYDKITLKDTLQQGDYRSLGISISNLTIGTSSWDRLSYRLATLDDSGVTFGTNPRLEFPQDSKSALQNWFAETEDARGQRLELRFAKPDAMDLQVWSALAENDKLLIAGLISSLGNQLSDLEHSNELVKTDWNEWQMLANSIKQIAAKKITA